MLNYKKFVYNGLPGANDKPAGAPGLPAKIDGRAASSQEAVKAKQAEVDATKKDVVKIEKEKDELFNYWLNNDGKFKVKEDNFLYETLNFQNQTIAKEAFILLSIIKKYWGEDKAKEVYAFANEGGNFYLKRVSIFFATGISGMTVEEVEEINLKKDDYLNGEQAKREVGIYWSDGKWYVWNNVTGSKDELIGQYLHLNLKKLELALKKPDAEYLVDEARRTEVTTFLNGELDKVKVDKKSRDAKIIEWAQKSAVNKWEALPDEIHMYMRLNYGEKTGYYVYRYDAEKKKIYALRIKGADLASGLPIISQKHGTAACIDINDNNELVSWSGYTDGEEFIKSTLAGKMSPVEVQRELVDYKGKEQPGSLTEDQKLIRTKGMVAAVMADGNFAYELMDKDYLAVVEEKLIKKLKEESSLTEDQAKDIARLRKNKLKESIDKYIDEKAEALKKAKEEDPKVKFNITVNSNDEVEIKFEKTEDKLKYSQYVQDAKKTAEEADLDSIVDQKTEDITKKLGFLGMFLKWFKIDIKSDVAEYFKTGKKSIFLTIAGAISGVEIGRRVLKGKLIETPEDFEKLVQENGGVLKSDREFKNDFRISGYKITIPKGKGIKPGKTFTASGVEIKIEEEKKDDKKPKIDFLSFFSSKPEKDEFVMKDKEIVITQNDIIPKETVIPKDAKIEKVA